MRTTLNFDESVLDQARFIAEKSGLSFKAVINQAMRLGLDLLKKGQKKKAYQTKPQAMNLKKGLSLDHIQDLLDHIEGEDAR